MGTVMMQIMFRTGVYIWDISNNGEAIHFK